MSRRSPGKRESMVSFTSSNSKKRRESTDSSEASFCEGEKCNFSLTKCSIHLVNLGKTLLKLKLNVVFFGRWKSTSFCCETKAQVKRSPLLRKIEETRGRSPAWGFFQKSNWFHLVGMLLFCRLQHPNKGYILNTLVRNTR